MKDKVLVDITLDGKKDWPIWALLTFAPYMKKKKDLDYNIKYSFDIEYMGGIEKKFKSLIELLDYSKKVKLNKRLLNKSTCLLEKLLFRLRKLEAKETK